MRKGDNMKKKDWHDIKLAILTMISLIGCPITFYLAIVKHPAWLIATVLCGIWLFLFELANGVLKGE